MSAVTTERSKCLTCFPESTSAIFRAMARLRRRFLRKLQSKKPRLSLQVSHSESRTILKIRALRLKPRVLRSVTSVMLRRIKLLSRWVGISKSRCMEMIEIKTHLRTSIGIEVCATLRILFLEIMLTTFK